MQRDHWNDSQWNLTVWTDKSRFCLQVNDGRVRVWRLRGEGLRDDLIVPTVQADGDSVLVCGAI